MTFREWWSKKKQYQQPTITQKVLAWIIGIPTAILVLVVVLLICGRLSGGRFGLIIVDGSSLYPELRSGDVVLVIPIAPTEWDKVVAWGILDGPETKSDTKRTLMVKYYRAGFPATPSRKRTPAKLVSSFGGGFSTEFEVRGRVVYFINLPWSGAPELKATRPAPTVDQQLSALGSTVNSNAMQRGVLREQLVGSIPFSSEFKQLGDRDLDSVLSMAREQSVSIKITRPFTRATLWLVGDDIVLVNDQQIRASGDSVVVSMPKPATVLKIKCAASSSMAPPGMIIREVVIK